MCQHPGSCRVGDIQLSFECDERQAVATDEIDHTVQASVDLTRDVVRPPRALPEKIPHDERMADKKIEQVDNGDVEQAKVSRIVQFLSSIFAQNNKNRNITDNTEESDERVQQTDDDLKSDTKIVDDGFAI